MIGWIVKCIICRSPATSAERTSAPLFQEADTLLVHHERYSATTDDGHSCPLLDMRALIETATRVLKANSTKELACRFSLEVGRPVGISSVVARLVVTGD
jgi:hypothetical protein